MTETRKSGPPVGQHICVCPKCGHEQAESLSCLDVICDKCEHKHMLRQRAEQPRQGEQQTEAPGGN